VLLVDRYLRAAIRDDALADRKMAFISGPRQAGKTTPGRSLIEFLATNAS
jgi:predicted AAA+ superfamily ATPase